MHILSYALGMGHYLALPLVFWSIREDNMEEDDLEISSLLAVLDWIYLTEEVYILPGNHHPLCMEVLLFLLLFNIGNSWCLSLFMHFGSISSQQ